MAKKNSDVRALATALILIGFLFGGVFFVLKWFIVGAITLCSVIIVWGINFSKKKQKERLFQKWEDSLFGDSYIRPTKNVDRQELKEKLGFIDTTIYDDLFDPRIIERGKEYVWKKKITKVSIKNNTMTSIVQGKETYNVTIHMEKDSVKKAECTCPHFLDNKEYCKHIYATLYFSKSALNTQKVLDSISVFSKQLSKLVEMETNYINEHRNTLDSEEASKYLDNIHFFENTLFVAKKNIDQNGQYEDVMFSTLVDLMQDSYKLICDVETMIIEADKVENPFIDDTPKRQYSNNNSNAGAIAAGLLFANELGKNEKNKNDKLEKEMDIYGLYDWQKEEVRKGNYDPWSFEEENLEEDDYFYDDSD